MINKENFKLSIIIPCYNEKNTISEIVDRILDMIRTSVNVCGDAAVACIVANSEKLIDRSIFNK